MMPPRGRAAAGRADARTALVANLEGVARSRRASVAQSGPSAGPPAESRRVRQRDSRPACRRRRCLSAAAARRLERRLRQQRRRARACRRCCSRAISLPPSASARWRSAIPRRRRWASCSASARTSRRIATSTGCRSARSAACSFDRRCRSTASTSSRSGCSAPTSARCAGSSIRISSRSPWTASACTSRRSAATRRSRRRATTRPRPATMWRAVHRARAAQGRAARRSASRSSRRRTRSTRGGCRTTCAAPSDTIDFSGYPHIDEVILDRAVQADRRRRHAEPPPHLRVPARRRPPKRSRARDGF